jgi:hypothetical protein
MLLSPHGFRSPRFAFYRRRSLDENARSKASKQSEIRQKQLGKEKHGLEEIHALDSILSFAWFGGEEGRFKMACLCIWGFYILIRPTRDGDLESCREEVEC